MTIHGHVAVASIALGLAGACVACGGSKSVSAPPATAGAKPATQAPHAGTPGTGSTQPQPGEAGRADRDRAGQQGDAEDAELVVSREVVQRCPTLRIVKAHVAELDPDMVWLAVLESIAECMGEGGPMSAQSLGVSGDEEHRHVIREVLGTRGVAPTRIVAEPQSAAGAAECQGGIDCRKRVEITLIVP